nr:D-alanyl-D-alanine carboxypeptidase family protein [Sedimentibacter sp.]
MKKASRILSICLIVIMLSNTVVFGEINVNEYIKGALLGDVETGEILYEYNINEQLAIASISKLMTYLLMKEAVSNNEISLDDDVTISGHAAATEGSRFGLVSGETLKLSMLTKGMLIVSGNDCATAIAEYVGKTEDNFVKMMNEKAAELGLMSASFINPSGLPINDEETGQNYMSISDIFKLARYILTKYPETLEITSQKELVVPERNFSKASTNPVFGVIDGVDGLKTGYTDKSGLCLVSTMPISGSGQDFRLIAIIMGAQSHEDRIDKTKQLLEYGRDNFSSQKLTDTTVPVDTVYVSSSKIGKIDVYPSTDFKKLVKNGEVVKTQISYNEGVSAPLSKGEKIGTVNIYVNDKEVGQVDAIVNEDIKKANIFIRVFRFIQNLFGL